VRARAGTLNISQKIKNKSSLLAYQIFMLKKKFEDVIKI